MLILLDDVDNVCTMRDTGSSVFEDPRQLAIDTISGNIFVADYATNKI